MDKRVVSAIKILRKGRVYRFLRSFTFALFLSGIGVYALLYLLISLPGIQSSIRDVAETELSKLLGAEVKLGDISIRPFKQFLAHDLSVTLPVDSANAKKRVLYIRELGAGLSLYNLIFNQRLVFTYAEILGLEAYLWRDNPEALLNIEPIISRFRKNNNDGSSKFDLKIYNIVIRQSSLMYDVISEPVISDRFDKNHVKIENFTADVVIPRLSNKRYSILVKRLALKEQSGFRLKGFSSQIHISDSLLAVNKLNVDLPETHLEFEDISMEINSLDSLKRDLASLPLNITSKRSHICAADFASFVPALSKFQEPLDFSLSVAGTVSNPVLSQLLLDNRGGKSSMRVAVAGELHEILDKTKISANLTQLDLEANEHFVGEIIGCFPSIPENKVGTIKSFGNVKIKSSGCVSTKDATLHCRLKTQRGDLKMDLQGVRDTTTGMRYVKVSAVSPEIALSGIFPEGKINLSKVGFEVKAHGTFVGKQLLAFGANALVNSLTVNGYTYKDIEISASGKKDKEYEGTLILNDPNAFVDFSGKVTRNKDKLFDLNSTLEVEHLNFSALSLDNKYPGYELGFNFKAEGRGHSIDDATGNIVFDNIGFANTAGEGYHLDRLSLYAFGERLPKSIILDSDLIRATVSGDYHFKSLVESLKQVAGKVFPSLAILFKGDYTIEPEPNVFSYEISVNPNSDFYKLFKVPIQLLQSMKASGSVDSRSEFYSFYTEVPYLQQKNKLIENSRVSCIVDGKRGIANVEAATSYPVKRGIVDVKVSLSGDNGLLKTDIGWNLNVEKAFHGAVSTVCNFDYNNDKLNADIDVQRSELVFNDTVWTLEPARINIYDKSIMIDGLEARCDKQFVKIDGSISSDPDDQLFVNLHDINLDFVFETLAIPNVSFGGRGTGEFWASNLFSKIPTLATERFHVEDLAYNNCVLGNTDIVSRWNNETMGIDIDARIRQRNGEKSTVIGAIFPTKDSLYLDFDVKHTPVQFLLPYMQAFTSCISGTASGKGTLFGKFKTINFKGDLLAEDFKLKIDYLNTVYSCSDSIHIKPNYISLDNLTISDKFGHTAHLDGYVKHKAFHEASMDIAITDAHNLLCYDITSSMNPDWYGTIFGNGNARVYGSPGVLDINVNMASAPGSAFTFVMSGREAVDDYDFITFNDRNKDFVIEAIDTVPEQVRALKLKKNDEDGSGTALSVNVQAEINPDINITLVMDPAGGDKIRATGSGSLSMGYRSSDNDFYMRGKYTLNKGSYNFTLQDIIIKDFVINEGSSIIFQGNPQEAEMDITAVYRLNASLTDLDDSFAMDKDLNRTNVPVQAVLHAKGDIEQPVIKFDLNFPTLSDEAYRKVKSIVSTDDMMNRQILYLVALNRFYTPEYMSASTNSNEFANVASSTISSQLSNILGQISDNWTIAPNFRTNKGDFSDMEVDVALSSQLLNNRLLLNGNFGYRDNSMNNSSTNFIGDFDIEYLLTRNGNIRLKAYNHYNDQNYYIKSALTTQGVGVVFKFDFNNPLDLFNYTKYKLKTKLDRNKKNEESAERQKQ